MTNEFCTCKDGPVTEVGFFEKAPLRDGHWTYFAILKCDKCKKLKGFPHDNFLNALKNGSPETLEALENLGIQTDQLDSEMNPSLRNYRL